MKFKSTTVASAVAPALDSQSDLRRALSFLSQLDQVALLPIIRLISGNALERVDWYLDD